MTGWYKLDLGDAMLADARLDEVKAQLSAVCNAKEPAVLQALSRYESKGVHCHLILYITADLQDKALLVGATACEPPPINGCEFLFK